MSQGATGGPRTGASDATALQGAAKDVFNRFIHRRAKALLRWRYVVLSTVGLVAATFIAGKLPWPWFLIPLGVAVLCAALAGTITVARDRVTRDEKQEAAEAARRADQLAEDSEAIAKRLILTVTSAGLPLVKTLGDICGRETRGGYDLPTAMINQVLEAVRRRIGTDYAQNRAIYYQLEQSRLVLVDWVGRGQAPNHLEWSRADPEGHAVLAFIEGTGDLLRLVRDVAQEPDRTGATPTYKSYMAARVTAGRHRFGLLCVDSPEVENFTDRDRNPMTLLAGLLGAGVAAAALASPKASPGDPPY